MATGTAYLNQPNVRHGFQQDRSLFLLIVFSLNHLLFMLKDCKASVSQCQLLKKKKSAKMSIFVLCSITLKLTQNEVSFLITTRNVCFNKYTENLLGCQLMAARPQTSGHQVGRPQNSRRLTLNSNYENMQKQTNRKKHE